MSVHGRFAPGTFCELTWVKNRLKPLLLLLLYYYYYYYYDTWAFQNEDSAHTERLLGMCEEKSPFESFLSICSPCPQ